MSQSNSGPAHESARKAGGSNPGAPQGPGAPGSPAPSASAGSAASTAPSAGARGGSASSGESSVTTGSKDPAEKKPKGLSKERAGADRAHKQKGQAKESHADWLLFRTAVALVGLLLAGFGVYFVLIGTAGLPEPTSEINPTLESQFRFFAALLTGVGIAFLTIAIKFEWANVLWFVCAMVFIGGIARVISWALTGTPHVVMIVLMVVELAAPPVLVVWHRWVTKTQELKRSYSGGAAG